jgi:hypothetical protein
VIGGVGSSGRRSRFHSVSAKPGEASPVIAIGSASEANNAERYVEFGVCFVCLFVRSFVC